MKMMLVMMVMVRMKLVKVMMKMMILLTQHVALPAEKPQPSQFLL